VLFPDPFPSILPNPYLLGTVHSPSRVRAAPLAVRGTCTSPSPRMFLRLVRLWLPPRRIRSNLIVSAPFLIASHLTALHSASCQPSFPLRSAPTFQGRSIGPKEVETPFISMKREAPTTYRSNTVTVTVTVPVPVPVPVHVSGPWCRTYVRSPRTHQRERGNTAGKKRKERAGV